jgi:hypothetical protein
LGIVSGMSSIGKIHHWILRQILHECLKGLHKSKLRLLISFSRNWLYLLVDKVEFG